MLLHHGPFSRKPHAIPPSRTQFTVQSSPQFHIPRLGVALIVHVKAPLLHLEGRRQNGKTAKRAARLFRLLKKGMRESLRGDANAVLATDKCVKMDLGEEKGRMRRIRIPEPIGSGISGDLYRVGLDGVRVSLRKPCLVYVCASYAPCVCMYKLHLMGLAMLHLFSLSNLGNRRILAYMPATKGDITQPHFSTYPRESSQDRAWG